MGEIMISLRDVDETNYEACADIVVTKEQGIFTNAPVWSLVQAAYADFKDKSKLYAIHYGDEVAGLIRLDYFYPDWYEFTNLIVDTAYQGKGIATQACRLAIEKFCEDGRCKVVKINVSPDNIAATHIYTKIGFRNTGILYKPDSNLEVWEYQLNT